MKTTELVGAMFSTTRLGFGTAALMGRLGRNASLRLLDAAYDAGIRHFDTAPLYGYGETEAVVGEFAYRRSGLTIATKIGLRAQAQGPLQRNMRALARFGLSKMPKVAQYVGRSARRAHGNEPSFALDVIAQSIARSRALLRRETLDLLLLHECRPRDLAMPELLDFLRRLVRTGEIRAFGIATSPLGTIACASTAPAFTQVVQTAHNASTPTLARLPSDGTYITHSPFGGVGAAHSPESTARSALRDALKSNARGVVLFSTQRVERIYDNASVLEAL